MLSLKKFAACLALGLASATVSFATPLLPGTSVAAAATSIGSYTIVAPVLSGAMMADTFRATYQTTVISDSGNPFCAGCLDVVYQITNTGSASNGFASGIVERITGYNFGSFLTDAGYIAGTGNEAPLTVDRSANGSVVGFNFMPSNAITAGQSSMYLVVKTNASSYTSGLFSAIDGSTSTVAGYAPANSPVPEPSSLLLLGTGLVSAAGAARRKLFAR